MEPVLKIYQPLPGIGLIKIYQPTIHDNTMISFLVMVDSRAFSFKLYHNGEWNEFNKEGITKELVVFIRKSIEKFYGY